MSNTPSQIVVKGQIADNSGHTEFAGSIDDAMSLIMKQVTTMGKWVYVNGNPFMFTKDHTIAEQEELRGMLTTAKEPTFMLTAALVGGSSRVKTRAYLTKRPLGSLGSRRNHITVSLSKKGGVDDMVINISDYNGMRGKLANHKAELIAALTKAIG